MSLVCCLLLLTGALPLWQAWRVLRATSLNQALHWTIGTWLAWVATMAMSPTWPDEAVAIARYLSIGLVGCAGVAVFGARRPGAGAWNFVVVGLLALILLPLMEATFALGGWRLGPFAALIVGGALAVSLLNYLPTRLGLAVLVLAASCLLEIIDLAGKSPANPRLGNVPLSWWLLGLTPWLGIGLLRLWPRRGSEFDRQWRDFRDRYGMVWALRLRDQFNRAAAHAGWQVELTWYGLRGTADTLANEEMKNTLQALMKRFGTT